MNMKTRPGTKGIKRKYKTVLAARNTILFTQMRRRRRMKIE
ncbi:hypothetical protein E2C01_018022 [Portunus trituberculatus]|uniref:Uncharacterized protein n=1 Tax=Portunus trituberculatus TaxID=210409 RepID=A0A5B7DV31_PORTR|nr:hypothetical protein [Portunus trituberculatus]